MARARTKVVLNLAALNQVQQALAHGLLHLGHEIALEAASNVPLTGTAPHHIREQWGAAVYVDGKKVGDVSYDGSAVAKPRAVRIGKGLSGFVGFGYPGRFLETGTSDTAAQPFLTPAAEWGRSNAAELIRLGAGPYWP